jgi:hypothetical protein
MGALCLSIGFITWILLMIPWQFQKVREKAHFLAWINRAKILPVYTFFSPNPGKVDSHLLYRDSKSEGNTSVTEWREVITIPKRQAYSFIWNPEKRINKLVIDAVAELRSLNNFYYKLKLSAEDLAVFFQLNRGYIALLNFVSDFDKLSPDSTHRQFMIVDVTVKDNQRQTSPLFISGFHRL